MKPALNSFSSLTGSSPEGSWLAPGRLNLIGEHTDYNDGFALPIALGLGTEVAAATRDDGTLNAYSLQRPDDPLSIPVADLRPDAMAGWSAYPAGVLWALGEDRRRGRGLDLVVSSEVPLGAGLSSSAALTCAVALATAELFGLDLPRPALASLAQRAEQEFVGVPVGILDQTATLLCRKDCALLLDARSLAAEQIPLALERSGLCLLVIDTRAPRQLRDGVYADRRLACEQAARYLGLPALRDLPADELGQALESLDDPLLHRRTRHVVSENARVAKTATLLRAGEIAAIGPLLSASHTSLRDDFDVSSPALDAAVDAAIQGGALGARMTGAGFGGSALALVSVEEVPLVQAAIEAEFVRQHFPAPRIFKANPSDGASRTS